MLSTYILSRQVPHQNGWVCEAETEIEGKPAVCNLNTGANSPVALPRMLKTRSCKEERSGVFLKHFSKNKAGKVTRQASGSYGAARLHSHTGQRANGHTVFGCLGTVPGTRHILNRGRSVRRRQTLQGGTAVQGHFQKPR